MPKQIQIPTIGQKLVKLFALKGRFQPLLDEIIVPVVEVGAEEVEERPAFAGGLAGAAAAENGLSWIRNPNDSNKIIQVQGFRCDAGGTAYLDFTTTLLWTLGTQNAMAAAWRDTSVPGVPVAVTQVGSSTGGPIAAGNRFYTDLVGAGTMGRDFRPLDVTLHAGQGLQAELRTANLSLQFSWVWTEQDEVAQG